TPKAAPPNGVRVRLDCLDERQSLSSARSDERAGTRQPSIGDACDDASASGNASGDVACAVQLNAPTPASPDGIDRTLFCHPKLNVCVRPCAVDTDCPPAWVCDDRSSTVQAAISATHPRGSAICVNPTCGDAR